MDLYIVQIDPVAPQRNRRISSRILGIVGRATRRYKGFPVILGTVEYSVFAHFVGSTVPLKFLLHELPPEEDATLYGEAQELAQELALRIGGDKDLLFGGINLFDILLYDLTVPFLTILRIEHLARSKAGEHGLLVLVTGFRLFSRRNLDSELPVAELVQIGNPKWNLGIRSLVKSLLRSYLRLAPAAIKNWPPYNIPDVREDKRRILFVVTDSGTGINAEALALILEGLRRHEDIVPFVAVDNSFTEQYLRQRQIACSRYGNFRSAEAEDHWAKSEPSYRKRALELVQECGPETVEGLMLSTFLRSYLTAPIASQVYSRALWLNEIFERFRPDAVVTFPVYAYLGRIASRMARIDRVPTLMFYHTIPSGMKPHPEFIGSDVTDYVAVCNEQFKATLAASGVSPTKVIVVGNPKFDAIPSRSRFEDRNYVCNKFGANAGADILLVASHILAPGTKEWLCALVRQLKKLDPNRFKLIIKPHPGEDPDVYERILQEEGFSGATISRQVPLYCLLNASDIVFVSHSTVGSEAVLFDRPLICINLTGIPYSVRYDEEGVALLVRKEADILPAIEAVLHDKRVKQRLQRARRQFQQRYAFRLDGRSTDRFANVIRLMATKSLHFNSERRDNVG